MHNPIFLSAPVPALVWVTIANIWRGTAFSMIMQYAGMKTVPAELYEAATVDGAGALQKFRYVTLPSLRGILLINMVLITIATLNTFDMVLPLTGGGPGRATEVMALYIYHLVFSEFQFGRGAAVAVLLMTVGLALSVLQSVRHAATGARCVKMAQRMVHGRGGGRGGAPSFQCSSARGGKNALIHPNHPFAYRHVSAATIFHLCRLHCSRGSLSVPAAVGCLLVAAATE